MNSTNSFKDITVLHSTVDLLPKRYARHYVGTLTLLLRARCYTDCLPARDHETEFLGEWRYSVLVFSSSDNLWTCLRVMLIPFICAVDCR